MTAPSRTEICAEVNPEVREQFKFQPPTISPAEGIRGVMVGVDLASALPALAAFPNGLYVMTAAHDGRRSGLIARWAMQCSAEPPMIAVSIFRGHWAETLIRDSHCFALCRVDINDKLVQKKFSDSARRDCDPFDCLSVDRLSTGAPVLKRAFSAIDCVVVRHLDLEADHSLYIGQVVNGRVYDPAGVRRAMESDRAAPES
ncbi:MAG: flavin reductase family protein [Planctomycetota bacterium]